MDNTKQPVDELEAENASENEFKVNTSTLNRSISDDVKKNIRIMDSIFKQGTFTVSKAYDKKNRSHFYTDDQGFLICRLLHNGNLTDVANTKTGKFIAEQYKSITQVTSVVINTNTCNSKQKGKTGSTKHSGHAMDNSIVTSESNTCIYDKTISTPDQIKQVINRFQFWEKTVTMESANTTNFFFKHGSVRHTISLYTREGNITISGDKHDRIVYVAYALLIGDIPSDMYLTPNEHNALIQQINSLAVDVMAVTSRPQITVTRHKDKDTIIAIYSSTANSKPEESLLSHMTKLMYSVCKNLEESESEITCKFYTGWIKIHKHEEQVI
jgi:hypothetical protein